MHVICYSFSVPNRISFALSRFFSPTSVSFTYFCPMNPELILTLIIIIFLASWILGRVLSWLNMRSHDSDVPDELEGEVDPEEYERSHDYHRANYRLGWIESILSLVLILFLLLSGGFGWLDAQLRQITEHFILLPLLYFGVLGFASDLLSLPFQLYHTFGIEERFGFNKSTVATFWMDKLKGYLLSIIIGGGVLSVFLWLVQELGQGFWIWFWIFATVFMIVMNLFYTSWLLPIFNKLTPLEDDKLREAIENYAQKVEFPLTNILVMDGSRRSSKANAFFSGLGKRKKVVLFDTLIEQLEQDELVAVLAHEVGHYKKRHIITGLVLGTLQTGLMLFILSLFIDSPELSLALGGDQLAVHLNLLAFGLLYSPISTLLGIGMNIVSRRHEYQADHYAADTYAAEPLGSALIELHLNTLSNLTPHPAYVFVNYSHPPLVRRLRALEEY